MEKITEKKNGLVYTDDFKVVVGIDSESTEFTGAVPNGVQSVEEEAFSCCNLTKISLPDSVTYLGANLFCNSTELEFVRLPAPLKTLPPFLFCGCKSLKEVEMPLEVEDFSEGLFAECTSLEEIPFRAGIKTLPEGCIDTCTSIKSLVIPDSVTEIKSGAIANCDNLETLVLPAKLEILEEGWLTNCPKLKHIRISEDNVLFRTSEESDILYRVTDSGEVEELKLDNKSADSLPGFKEPDTENSIITFDESEDETMDETNIFNADEIDMTEDAVDSAVKEDSEEVEETAAGAVPAEEESLKAPEESASDMDSRLAEILGQNKMYDEGDFSIMDIPQASEEEIASNSLASATSEEEKFANEPTVQVTVPEMPADQSPEDMEERLKEIMGQSTNDFSINDIPMASDEELSANKIIESAGNSASSETEETDGFVPGVPQEESEFGSPVSDDDAVEESLPLPQTPVNEDKAFMQSLVFESQKVLQQNTDIKGASRILFVFAENLASTSLGEKFSTHLQNCCNRLAKIHKFTSIYYFNEIRMDNEKFRSQLVDFMKDKDVLIACEGSNLYDISDHTVVMCNCLDISLTKEDISKEVEMASDPTVKPLKLIVQDNLAE